MRVRDVPVAMVLRRACARLTGGHGGRHLFLANCRGGLDAGLGLRCYLGHARSEMERTMLPGSAGPCGDHSAVVFGGAEDGAGPTSG